MRRLFIPFIAVAALSASAVLVACDDDDDNDVPTPGTATTPAGATQTTPAGSAGTGGDEDEYDLDERNDSGVEGKVIISEGPAGLSIRVELDSTAAVGPIHVYRGSCDDIDEPVTDAPVASLGGMMSGTLPITKEQLDDDDYAVVVHQSAADTTPAACATI